MTNSVVTDQPTVQPRNYAVNEKCSAHCTLHPARYSEKDAGLILRWYQEGWNNPSIQAKAAVLDIRITPAAIARHRAGHLTVMAKVEEEVEEDAGKDLTDIEILDKVIREGSKQLAKAGSKISPEMTMRAMELKYKLTAGSVMGDTFDAIGAAMDRSMNETPDAAASPDEQAQSLADAAPEVSLHP